VEFKVQKKRCVLSPYFDKERANFPLFESGRKEGRKRLGIGVLIGILLLASSEIEFVGGNLET
jgi:hypothetical protein